MIIRPCDERIASEMGKVVSGYKITDARRKTGEYSDSGNYIIVLAKSVEKDMYVVWQGHLDGEDFTYYWGHYIEDKDKALEDYFHRA